MAKHNIVNLYGVLLSPPSITLDEKQNRYTKGSFVMVIISADRDIRTFDKVRNYSYSCPVILTQNEAQIEKMADMKQWDIVEIKGMIQTKNIIKKTLCPHCKQPNRVHGKFVTIMPIYMNVRGYIEGMPDDGSADMQKILETLKDHIEISNQATVIGTLCADPETYMVKKGKKKGFLVTMYKLAVDRKIRVVEDDSTIRSDYPWVKSYGAMAENDAKALRQRSVVFIDGLIKTRTFKRTTVCDNCKEVYEWEDSTLEISPYSIEYLRNYYTSEDSKEMEEKKNDEYYKEVSVIEDEQDIDKVNYGDVTKESITKEKSIMERKIVKSADPSHDNGNLNDDEIHLEDSNKEKKPSPKKKNTKATASQK